MFTFTEHELTKTGVCLFDHLFCTLYNDNYQFALSKTTFAHKQGVQNE